MSDESKENEVAESEEQVNDNGNGEGADVKSEKGDSKEAGHTVSMTEYKKVRAQFDNILNKHITRLIEIDTESKLQFDTCTVACLVLLVERDREIKNFPKSPPERYNRESFFNDLSDIGLEIDYDLMATFENLVKLGYVGIDQEERYSALISTLALVKFIDNLFSGMSGLNLVAYIIQCIDEILTGRKELKENLSNFEQTLGSRGVAISKQNLQEEEKETIKKTATTFKVSKESLAAAEKLKKTNVQKLASLRTIAVRKPSQQRPIDASQVKELFPRKGAVDDSAALAAKAAEKAALELEERKEEIRRREEELKKAEEENLELERKKQEIAAKEEDIRRAELAAKEAEIALKEAEIKAAEIAAKEAEMAAKEAALAAKEAEIEALKEQKEEARPEEPEEESLSIEDQIAAFEADLAMPCPICSIGKITSEKTEKDKTYFACTNKTCKFVSWAKPYHFQCPLCKNPYLVEFPGPDGTAGLKCPRAVCSFSQQGIHDPQAVPQQAAPASAATAGAAPKKKKKIIRRKKR